MHHTPLLNLPKDTAVSTGKSSFEFPMSKARFDRKGDQRTKVLARKA